jgi:hypothetical protein
MDLNTGFDNIDLNTEPLGFEPPLSSPLTSNISENAHSKEKIKNRFDNNADEDSVSSCEVSPQRNKRQNEQFANLKLSAVFGEHLLKAFDISPNLLVDDDGVDKDVQAPSIPEADLEKIPFVKYLREENHRLKRKLQFLIRGYKRFEKQALCNILWQNVSIETRQYIEEVIRSALCEGAKSTNSADFTRSEVNTLTTETTISPSESQSKQPHKNNDRNVTVNTLSHDTAETEVFDLDAAEPQSDVTEDITNLFKPHPGYLGNTQYYQHFAVDTALYPVDIQKANVKYFEVPSYERRMHEPLPLPPEQLIREHVVKCFNCGSPDHTYLACPLPHNPEVIAMHRRELQFIMEENKIHLSSERRYFDEEKPTQEEVMSRQFKPGVLSDALREALGLEEGQYPPYYQRMLVFGYPPGYLAREVEEEPPLVIYNNPEDYQRANSDSHIKRRSSLPPYKIPYTPTVIYPGLDFKGNYGSAVERLVRQSRDDDSALSSSSSMHSVLATTDLTFDDDHMVIDRELHSSVHTLPHSSPSPKRKWSSSSKPPASGHGAYGDQFSLNFTEEPYRTKEFQSDDEAKEIDFRQQNKGQPPNDERDTKKPKVDVPSSSTALTVASTASETSASPESGHSLRVFSTSASHSPLVDTLPSMSHALPRPPPSSGSSQRLINFISRLITAGQSMKQNSK